jgi:NADH-quinone oxidoreductase subunit C
MRRLADLKEQARANGWVIEEAYGSTWVVVPRDQFKPLLADLKNKGWNYLADVVGIDYLRYPSPKPERFCVV